jgi:predicted phage terminase large subunit-like protein
VPLLSASRREVASRPGSAAGWHTDFNPRDRGAALRRRADPVLDCSFKDLDTSDYVVDQVWARLGDQIRRRMDCPATVKAVRDLTEKWPGTVAKLIEDKANGSAVIQMLQHEIRGLLPVNPHGGKVARAQVISPLVEAGNVYLLYPDYAPWVNDFIEECAQFPNGAHEDQVDAMTQALLRWQTAQPEVVVYRFSLVQIN